MGGVEVNGSEGRGLGARVRGQCRGGPGWPSRRQGKALPSVLSAASSALTAALSSLDCAAPV
jgi:hypothetical protein